MTHIGLFEGIGGFSLAARVAGWKTMVTCEIEPFCQRVLKYHFPDAYHHGDIKTLNYETIKAELSNRYGTDWRREPIVLTGGFPCQPYSTAGKRKGNEDDRHLWPEMLRVIREVSPEWVVGENVFGLISWSGGLVFEEVQTDLEAEGYEVWPVILPAASVGAPHRRDRVWFIALNANYKGSSSRHGSVQGKNEEISKWNNNAKFSDTNNGTITNTDNQGLQRSQKPGSTGSGGERQTQQSPRFLRTTWENFPTQPPVCRRNDGFPGKLDGITIPSWRNNTIKAFGNAIVPQIAYQLFQVINEIEKLTNTFLK